MGALENAADTTIRADEGAGTSGRDRSGPSPEQNRPDTPDQKVEDKQRSLKDELDEVRALYLAAKAGEKKDGMDASKPASYVELGVGWSVDPAYLVGKRILLYCSRGCVWHAGNVFSYDEETAVHEIQIDGQENRQKLPLTGVKVRIRVFLGQTLPPKPSLRRMQDVLEKLQGSISKGSFEQGFVFGIQRGMQKMKEAIWQQCYFIQNSEVANEDGPQDPDAQKFAEKLLTEDAEAIDYVNTVLISSSVSHLQLLTMPRWLESKNVPPGDVVWAKFGKQHWPCLVVSADHFMDLDGGSSGGFSISPQISQDNNGGKCKETVAIYYFGTNERELVNANRIVDFAAGLDKGYAKRVNFRKSSKIDKLSLSVRHAVEFARTGKLSDDLSFALEGVNDLRVPPHQVNASYIVPPDHSDDVSDVESSEDLLVENSIENEMVAKTFKGGWQPNANILKGISSGDLEVISLGRVETINPHYHSNTLVWPVGYKIKRKLKSEFTADGKKEHHIIEILPPDEKQVVVGQPRFRVTMERKERGKAKLEIELIKEGPTEKLAHFIRSTGIVKKVDTEGVLGVPVATLLGLTRPAIRQAIFMLPGVEKCQRIPMKRVLKERLNFLRQGKFLLDEMKACQLPEGIQPVPLQRGRAFECQVCGDIEEDDQDQILQCDGCKHCVHMSCYSVGEAPHGSLWLCDVCQARPSEDQRPACVLCPVKGGVMKRTTEGKWCHPACAIWIPETHLLRDETYLNLTGLIGGVKRINRSRLDRRCMFCRQNYGAVIQCCGEGDGWECFKTFHYMCAKNNQCDLRIETHNPDQWAGPASPEPLKLGSSPIHPEGSAKGDAMEVDLDERERRLRLVKKDKQYPSWSNKAEIAANMGIEVVCCENCLTTSSPVWRLHGDEHMVVMCDDCFAWVTVFEEHRPSEQWESNRAKKNKGLGKKKRKKSDPKGLAIGDTRLLSFCPKHSSGCIHGAVAQPQPDPDTSDPSSYVDIDSRSFPGLDCAAWKKRNDSRFNKSSYMQATSLCPRGPVPEPCEAVGSMIKSDEVITDLGEGMGTRHIRTDTHEMGGRVCTGWLTQASVKKGIMSQADAYQRLVENWRLDIHPGKSAIHGWGAFAPDRNFKEGEMIIEYVGELVRPTFAEIREAKVYDDLVGAGTYVFRINPEYCVDATRTGNLAHLLNHSCDANCASRTITVKGKDGQPVDHVVIFADRDIQAGEELTYDYRFSGEEVLQCSCGSSRCRGKVNQPLPVAVEGGFADGHRLRRAIKRKAS